MDPTDPTATELPADPLSPEVTPEATEATEAAPLDPLEAALAEASKWKDQAYRHAAELDNFRKRMSREALETRQYANADLLRGLLPIMDTFDMGLESARQENDKSIIYIGMNMVGRQIVDFLKECGVTEVIPAAGSTFDPHQHDALSQEVSDTVAEGTVLRCTRKGFKLKERLLRAANVVVSSGPAKAEPETTA
jgi:molecular chaperone GrpE